MCIIQSVKKILTFSPSKSAPTRGTQSKIAISLSVPIIQSHLLLSLQEMQKVVPNICPARITWPTLPFSELIPIKPPEIDFQSWCNFHTWINSSPLSTVLEKRKISVTKIDWYPEFSNVQNRKRDWVTQQSKHSNCSICKKDVSLYVLRLQLTVICKRTVILQ